MVLRGAVSLMEDSIFRSNAGDEYAFASSAIARNKFWKHTVCSSDIAAMPRAINRICAFDFCQCLIFTGNWIWPGARAARQNFELWKIPVRR